MILEALILGFAGSFHCLAMCGPLHISLLGNRKYSASFLVSKSAFNIGRIITYALLGIVLGFIGKSLPLYEIQKVVSVVTGVAIILVYFIPKFTGKEIEIPFLNKFVVKNMGSLMQKTKDKSNIVKYFAMGVLNGLLPCGLVYVALIASFAQLNTTDSALYMLLFGLGTFPAMFFVVLLGSWAKKMISKFPKLNYLTALFVLLIGVMFILRGSNLGIKYLSPKDLDVNDKKSTHSCH
ncbi:MAG: sulfite exporter TauE/SafE family protein [Chitinophagales bacterium]